MTGSEQGPEAVRFPVAKDLTLRWSVRTAVTKSVTLSWNVLQSIQEQGAAFDEQHPHIRKAELIVPLGNAIAALVEEKYDVAGVWVITAIGAYVVTPIGYWWWKTQRPWWLLWLRR
jgi:hypothetical protein